jgi:hypothetical protein
LLIERKKEERKLLPDFSLKLKALISTKLHYALQYLEKESRAGENSSIYPGPTLILFFFFYNFTLINITQKKKSKSKSTPQKRLHCFPPNRPSLVEMNLRRTPLFQPVDGGGQILAETLILDLSNGVGIGVEGEDQGFGLG